jgi:hypothetical protein
VEFTTTREQFLDHSTETAKQREDTRNPAANRAEFAPEPSAATTVADRSGVFPRVVTPASVVEASTEAGVAAFMAEAAADADGGYLIF